MLRRSFLLVLTPFALLPWTASANGEPARAPKNLRVEYRTEPLGLDTPTPRFSWELDDERRGALQTAFQILVSESKDLLAKEMGEVWSLKLPVRDTNQVAFAGRELLPWRTYHWIVRTWDAEGRPSAWSAPASFTMGPMKPSDWQAAWITSEATASQPKGGFKGYRSAKAAKADDFKYIQIDLGAQTIFDNIVLHPARPHGDSSKPGVLFPLRFTAYVDDTPYFDAKFMKAGEPIREDIVDPGSQPVVIQCTRFKVRYVRIVIEKMQPDGDQGFAFAIGEMEVREGMNNVAIAGIASASDSLEEDGWSVKGLNDAILVPGQPVAREAKPVMLLRKPFVVSNTPTRALLAASALGLHDVTINGQRITDERLAPGWTDYFQRAPYAMYDVTALVLPGDNVIGVQLADGWYAGRVGVVGPEQGAVERGAYGTTPRFLAQMRIESSLGAPTIVKTDATWTWSRSGPIRSSDLIDGEATDWQNEQRGWDVAQFDDKGWKPAAVAKDVPPVFARVAEPVRERKGLEPVSFKELRPRVWLYDFGQVLTGVVRVNVDLNAFATMLIRHGEALDAAGNVYTGNLRKALQTDRLTLRPGQRGGFGPLFTLHSFRYVEISGNLPPPTAGLLTAIPITSDVREAGSFECSDPTLTQLWKNIAWTRRNNCVGLPTDGAGRDERLGWLGDASVFAHTAMFQADMASTYAQWLADVRSAQRADGRFNDFAPNPYRDLERAIGTPGRADAGVLVPWAMYLHYHDRKLLEASFDSMDRWIQHVRSRNPTLVWKEWRGDDAGDEFDAATLDHASRAKPDESVRKDLFATAYFARSCELAAKTAFALSRLEAAERLSRLANDVRAAFAGEFVGADGRLRGDSQGAYALALDFELFAGDPAAEARAAANLVRKIEEAGGVLTTGVHTTHRALLALSRHGHHALAVKLATRRDVPSWGHAVDQGATTVWERWDGWVAGRGFQDGKANSFSSAAFGAIGEWMVRAIGGIELEDRHLAFGPVMLEPILDGPTRSSAEGPRAFEHFRLRPKIDGLEWARCTHDSIAGRIAVSWRKTGDELTLECTVPPNTTAALDLPAADRERIREGGRPISEVAGLQVFGVANGTASIELSAGTYSFTSALKQ